MRDLLTSTSERAAKGSSKGSNPTLKADAVPVDAVVSTIGFPLVGGPAGTMEGGRQADVAKGILTAKNIPYIVAAPLLIQVGSTPLLIHWGLGLQDLGSLQPVAVTPSKGPALCLPNPKSSTILGVFFGCYRTWPAGAVMA